MQILEKDDRQVVQAGGELDLSVAQELREALEKASELGKADVVLDLTSVGYIDSAILQELIRIHSLLSKQDRRFVVLANRNSQPGQVLKTVMFHTIMPVYNNWEEMIE